MERICIENEEILHLSRYQKASFTLMTELNGKKNMQHKLNKWSHLREKNECKYSLVDRWKHLDGSLNKPHDHGHTEDMDGYSIVEEYWGQMKQQLKKGQHWPQVLNSEEGASSFFLFLTDIWLSSQEFWICLECAKITIVFLCLTSKTQPFWVNGFSGYFTFAEFHSMLPFVIPVNS